MANKPNFILIMTDQQRKDSIGCYGNKFVETPNLDKLAATGAQFGNCFTPWPVCSPARATMWTGVYPHKHNVIYNVYNVDNALGSISNVSKTVFDYLKEEKYTTAYFGKWHLGDKNPGIFDIWEGFNSHGGHWVDGIKDGMYKPDLQTNHCIKFLEEATREERPFIMVQGYYPPHDPYTAPKRFYKPYKDKGVPFPGYYAAVSNIDYNVGRIIEALNRTDLRENTILIFFSDHGETFGFREEGEHKFVCFDEAIRIPFIINWPGHIKKDAVFEPFIGLEDLMPTLLDYADCNIPEELPGRSIRPWLEGQTPSDWRQFYYVQVITYLNHYQQRCIRTDKWKLILSYSPHAVRTGPHSLYNLEDDPEEELDIFDNSREDIKHIKEKNRLTHMPSYNNEIRQLTIALREYAEKIDDSLGVRLADDVLRQLSE